MVTRGSIPNSIDPRFGPPPKGKKGQVLDKLFKKKTKGPMKVKKK